MLAQNNPKLKYIAKQIDICNLIEIITFNRSILIHFDTFDDFFLSGIFFEDNSDEELEKEFISLQNKSTQVFLFEDEIESVIINPNNKNILVIILKN